MVSVESKAEGDLVRICRHCIDVIKQASLVHRNSAIVCYRCKIKRNLDGIVAGAIHLGLDIEDSVYEEHSMFITGTRRKGFKSFIADGLVFYDPDTDIVRIEDDPKFVLLSQEFKAGLRTEKVGETWTPLP